jgi:hypothetical protein
MYCKIEVKSELYGEEDAAPTHTSRSSLTIEALLNIKT